MGILIMCASLESISIDDNLMLPISFSILCLFIEKILWLFHFIYFYIDSSF